MGVGGDPGTKQSIQHYYKTNNIHRSCQRVDYLCCHTGRWVTSSSKTTTHHIFTGSVCVCVCLCLQSTMSIWSICHWLKCCSTESSSTIRQCIPVQLKPTPHCQTRRHVTDVVSHDNLLHCTVWSELNTYIQIQQQTWADMRWRWITGSSDVSPQTCQFHSLAQYHVHIHTWVPLHTHTHTHTHTHKLRNQVATK